MRRIGKDLNFHIARRLSARFFDKFVVAVEVFRIHASFVNLIVVVSVEIVKDDAAVVIVVVDNVVLSVSARQSRRWGCRSRVNIDDTFARTELKRILL